MEVVRVEGSDPEWDRFVWDSPGGTIFHTLRFLGYHPSSRYDFANLAVREAGRLVCVIPGGRGEVRGRSYYRSPVGASFGGFVFADDRDLKAMFEALDTFKDFLKHSGFAGAEVALPPLCYSRSEDCALGFAMLSSGFRLVSREATAVVRLETVSADGLAPALRRNVRKADASGLAVEPGRDLDAFFDILKANLAAKGTTPTHTAEELLCLMDLFPDRIMLFEGRLGDHMVGGCLCLVCNERTALAFYICDDPESRRYRVAEGVLYNCMMWLKERGYAYLDLGTISIDGQVNWGLARFKSKFMARTHVRERYILEIAEGA
jgi:hypothetical protein